MKSRRSMTEINAEMDRINKRRPTKEQIQELAALFKTLYGQRKSNYLKLLDHESDANSISYHKFDENE